MRSTTRSCSARPSTGPSQPAGYVVSFTARYIQTTGTVTAGQANGLATVTLTYK